MKQWLYVIMFGIIFVADAQTQQNLRWRGSGMWGTDSKYDMLFDNFNVQTFQGKITKIDTLTPMPDMSYGVILGLKTTNDEHIVHLGPGWYIMYQDMNLGVGNEVEVKGCPAILNGKQFIIAVEISIDNKVLLVRDKDGIPYWAGFRKKM